MTCIVGIETERGVVIGGDSAGVGGYALSIRADTKVFERAGYVFGFTTSFRMGQLLRYAGHLPAVDTWDVDAFMATRFVDAVRDILKTGGFASNKDGTEQGGSFLVGVGLRLYAIHDDYQIARRQCGYDAVGCGADIAIGSLHATADPWSYTTPLDDQAHDRARKAPTAAAAFSAGVHAPFVVIDNYGAQAAA